MFLPVAVISWLLFATTADSTDTSNATKEVSENVSIPNIANLPQTVAVNGPTVNNYSHTVTSGQDLTGTHSEFLATALRSGSLQLIVRRPSNFTGCTREMGVRSPCFDDGQCSEGSKRVVKKTIQKGARANTEHLEYFSYRISEKLQNKGYVISKVQVTNERIVGSEGLVSLVRGGTLDKEVVLFMESQKGRGINFKIKIYVGPAAEAYKNQLDSLILNLKPFQSAGPLC